MISNEDNFANDIAIEGGEMYENVMKSTGGLSQTIINPIQQEIETNPEEASQPISKEQEQRCDSIVDSEAASEDIQTFSEVKITNKAIEDLSTSQASIEESTKEENELEVAKEQIYTETNEDEIQDRSIVEDTKFVVENHINETTGEVRNIEGEVPQELTSLNEQKVTETLSKNNELAVEQEKEFYEVAVDVERSLEETEDDKTIDDVEKENWQGKVENPSKVVDEEIIKSNLSYEIKKGYSFEGKEEYFANKVEGVGMDTEVLSSRADDGHAELTNEFENANGENLSSNGDNMDKETVIEEAELCEDATNYTSELSQTIKNNPILQDKEVGAEEASQTISQEREPKCESIVISEATSAHIDTVSEVNTTNKAIEDLSTLQLSKEENIREATWLKRAKQQIFTETDKDEIQARSMVEAPECMVEKEIHENPGELRSIEGELTPAMSSPDILKVTENLNKNNKLEVEAKEFYEVAVDDEKSLEDTEGDKTIESEVTPGTSTLDDQKVTENISKDNELEVELGKESYEVAVDDERSLEITEGDKTIEDVMEKDIWEDKIENPSKIDDEEIIKINEEVEKKGSFERKEECFANKDEADLMLDHAGMDTEVLTSRTDDEHAENLERNRLRNVSETANKENENSNEDDMAEGTTVGGEMSENTTNSTRELSQIIDKDLTIEVTEAGSQKASQPILREQEHNHSIVDSEANSMEKALEEGLENDIASEATDTKLATEQISEIDSETASQPISHEQEHNYLVADSESNTMEKAIEEDLDKDIICEQTDAKLAKEKISTASNEEERITGEHTEIMVARDIHENIEGETTQQTNSVEEKILTENLENNAGLEMEQGKETLAAAVGGERSLEEIPHDKTIDIVQQKETWDDKIDTPTAVVEEEILEINDSQQVDQGDTIQEKEVCLANAEIYELVGPDDDKEDENSEAHLHKDFDGSPSSDDSLEETEAGEVGETTTINDESNKSTETEAYKTDREQYHQAINVKGDTEGDDFKENGDAEEFRIKESAPKKHNQEDICDLEAAENTIHNDDVEKVIPEIVGYGCNLTTEEAKEVQSKDIYNDDTDENKVEEVKEPDVTIEIQVPKDVSQVIEAETYECQAYEEKGERKENTNASLLLEESKNNEDEKMNKIIGDLAVITVSSEDAALENLQGYQGQKPTKEDFSTKDGNPNEENDNTVTLNIESELEELKDNKSKTIGENNSQGILVFNEKIKQEENIHEIVANSSNEEKDHAELTGIEVCGNDKISEEAKSNGEEAFSSSLSPEEIKGDELHKTDEIISEEKLETIELNRNGEEIPNNGMSSSEPSVTHSIMEEEANQAINGTNGVTKDDGSVSEIEKEDSTGIDKEENFHKDEDRMLVEFMVASEQGKQVNKSSCHTEILEAQEKAEQSDIIITQTEKIAERSEALNITLQEDVSQEMVAPTKNMEKEIATDEEIKKKNESVFNAVPNNEDKETKQEEKFSKISDYWPGGYKEETSNVNTMDKECSTGILTEAEGSTGEIDVKGEEVLCVGKASEVDGKGGEEKLDEKVSSSVESMEVEDGSQAVTGAEVSEKLAHENDESDNLPVSHFLMKHILQEQADNLKIINDEYEDSIKNLNEEAMEDEFNNSKKEEVQLIRETAIPEDEVGSQEFDNKSESVQEDHKYNVKEKSDNLAVMDDASIISKILRHSLTDDKMKLKQTEQNIQVSNLDIEEDTDPNVVEDYENQVMLVEEKMKEKEMQNDIETQDKYVDILLKIGGEESKEFNQDATKLESENQFTMDDCKLGEILKIEPEVTKEDSGEKKEEGSENSKEFHQDNEKVESDKQSSMNDTMDDSKVGEIVEIKSEVSKVSEAEKQDFANKGHEDVKGELELPETQNTDELQNKRKGEEEYEPDHSSQNAEIADQTSKVETIQKHGSSSNSSKSSSVKDSESEEEAEDGRDKPQIKKVTGTKVEDDETDDKKDRMKDVDAKIPEESSNEVTTMVEPREVELKPAQKKSHNILSGVGSKVKQSIAKVKKAIKGKSSPSKTLQAK